MQLKYLFISISVFNLLAITCKAQDCTVSVTTLSGKYEGECKKGKADGMGKAVGEDTYEGMFKAGYPDGKGKYTWKNGDWFEGEWIKGNKQGAGVMRYNLLNKDSMVTGFWKKDRYIGLYEKPYIIYKKSVHVTGIFCQHVNNIGNRVELFLNSEIVGLNAPSNSVPKAELTDIQIITGNYQRKTVNDSYSKKIGYLFEEVTFPFRAVYLINNGADMFEIEIAEPGRWMVEIRTAF
jgi:hypothetical protein